MLLVYAMMLEELLHVYYGRSRNCIVGIITKTRSGRSVVQTLAETYPDSYSVCLYVLVKRTGF